MPTIKSEPTCEDISNVESSYASDSEEDSDMTFEPETPKKKKESGRGKHSNKRSSKRNKNPRKDVVLKTILRKMRKFYTGEFNKATKFIARKRTHKEDLYQECLLKFIEARLPQIIRNGDRKDSLLE